MEGSKEIKMTDEDFEEMLEKCRKNISLQIACKMLNGDDPTLLNASLAEDIMDVQILVNAGGGELKSRQVIASIIMSWRKKHRGKKAYG